MNFNSNPQKKSIGSIIQDAAKGVSYSRNLEELRNNIDITIREVQNLAKAKTNEEPPVVKPYVDGVRSRKKQKTEPTESYVPEVSEINSAKFNSPSKGLYTFLLILGILLTSVFGLASCVCAICAAVIPFISGALWIGAGVTGLLALPSLALAVFAGIRGGKIKAFRKYQKYLGNDSFCTLEQMASACTEKLRTTRNNVKKMISAGWFPNGHLDDEETTLMLDEETYRMYLLAKDSRKQRENENNLKQKNSQAPISFGNPELDEAIREGRVYIQEIRRANDAIPEEIISRKMDQLENVTAKIFAIVEKKPEKLPEIRRFMNYYLPTTLKLLNAYQEFDSQPIQTQKILSAKERISQTLDTINQAFGSLLESLYEEDILDISSDISVLENMFVQEGLTQTNNFDLHSSVEKKP